MKLRLRMTLPGENPHGGDDLDLPESLVDGLRFGRPRTPSYRGMARNLGCASVLSTRRAPNIKAKFQAWWCHVGVNFVKSRLISVICKT